MLDLSELKISESLVGTFSDLIAKDRLPHAILLDGANKDVRTKTAEYLAAAFVCGENEKPCGKCLNCAKVLGGNHPDVVVSDPEEIGEKTFKISLVRDIRTDAFIMPNEAAKKVYILKSADKMNIQAQNALLKIIEEPPAYARFILECESRAAMLETIMSRVTAFNLGTAERLLDTEYLQKAEELAVHLAEAVIKPTELDFMRLTGAFEKDKELFVPVLSALQLIFRDAVAVKTGSDILLSGHGETSSILASKLSVKQLIELVNKCNYFYDCCNMNANRNLLITRFCSVIRQTAYGA
ncbi:MAG: hypothetical protein MJ168_03080 [Clostridia bacterium]|nr:hypothetical protein [Clostridia bacterium]